MPVRGYCCKECSHSFEIIQGFHDKRLEKCPECKKKALEPIVYVPTVQVREVKTIGQLAERNTKKLGKYGLEEKDRKNDKARGIDVKKVKEENKRAAKLANLSPEKKAKYIHTGEL